MQNTFSESINPDDSLKSNITTLFANSDLFADLGYKREAAIKLSEHLNPTDGQKITPLLVNFSKIRDKSIVATECEKYSIIETAADGNCLFHAVINSIEGITKIDIINNENQAKDDKWGKIYNLKANITKDNITKDDIANEMRKNVSEWYNANLDNTYYGDQTLSKHLINDLPEKYKDDLTTYITDFGNDKTLWGDNNTIFALANLYDIRIIVCSLDTNTEEDKVKKDNIVTDTDTIIGKKNNDPIYIHFESKTDAAGKSSAHYSGMVLDKLIMA